MARYYLIATAIVVLLGSIVFAHRLVRPDLRVVGRAGGTPKPESGSRGDAAATAPPFSGQGSWVLSALPACFDEESRVRGPAEELAAQIPPPSDRVPPGTTLHAGDCTLDVRTHDIWVTRGPDHVRVPPEAALYAVGRRYILVSRAGSTLELRRYSFAPALDGYAVPMSLPTRRLGRTNEMVSLIAMGGFHLGFPTLETAEAIRLVHQAVDRGITFLDNCWDYNDGASEERVGQALAQADYRQRVFLMTKFDGRDRRSATEQLDESLRRLRTEYVDLWQLHENIRPDDAERAFAPGGAIEAMLAAQQAGKVRYLGFTGHKSPDYHAHMFDVAERNGFIFDTVQMPINVMDAHFQSFARTVIPIAQRTDTAVLAMKTFGDHHILDTGVLDPIVMLHYSMNQPVAAVVTGIDRSAVLEQAIAAATSFRPLSDAEVHAILAQSAPLARDGATERYKTTHEYDGTMQHPEWLGSVAV